MICAGGGDGTKKGSNDALKTHTQGPPYTPPPHPTVIGGPNGVQLGLPIHHNPPTPPPPPPYGGRGVEMSKRNVPNVHTPPPLPPTNDPLNEIARP